MLEVLFAVLMIWIFGKILIFGVKAAWGISKFLLNVVLLPVILIVLVVVGLMYVAFPLLLAIGIVYLLLFRKS